MSVLFVLFLIEPGRITPYLIMYKSNCITRGQEDDKERHGAAVATELQITKAHVNYAIWSHYNLIK